ncbi:MAG: polymerase sigma factor, sigma-70 family [Capsulimonas sp.]|nr:polymerase sigma factor, sigma-70 family [Capsulimonas sp.]
MHDKWGVWAAILALSLFAPAAPPLDAKEQKAAPQTNGTSEVRYSGGGKVQLVGVSYSPSDGQHWWSAQGAPISHAPSRPKSKPLLAQGDDKARDFVFRCVGIPNNATVQITAPGSHSFDRWVTFQSRRPSALGIAATFPSRLHAASIRVGVAGKSWKSIAEIAPGGGGGVRFITRPWGAKSITLGISPPSQLNNSVGFTLSNTNVGADYQSRFAAMDRQGRLHPGVKLAGELSGRMYTQTISFPGMQLGDVQKIVFQTRSYEWREFKNIPLDPKS